MSVIAKCGWWARCPRRATGLMAHPVLGDLPICDECRKNVEANR